VDAFRQRIGAQNKFPRLPASYAEIGPRDRCILHLTSPLHPIKIFQEKHFTAAGRDRKSGIKLVAEELKRPQIKTLEVRQLCVDYHNHASGENTGLLFTNARRHGNVLKILNARVLQRISSS